MFTVAATVVFTCRVLCGVVRFSRTTHKHARDFERYARMCDRIVSGGSRTIRLTACPRISSSTGGLEPGTNRALIINRILDSMLMIAAVVQVSKPVLNSRHEDSAPVQPLCSSSRDLEQMVAVAVSDMSCV